MSGKARSVMAFGIYLAAIGSIVLLLPNVLFGVLGLPLTDEPWIRIAGIVVVALAGYYLICGWTETTTFINASIPIRVLAALGFVVVAAAWGHWVLLLFAAADAAGAGWTWLAVRREGEAAAL